ncbi:MAG: bifunctional pyr operon transcriptional regulator/uracil phosphoribosyltransferase PyrR [Gammaproteobacteria bacterium]
MAVKLGQYLDNRKRTNVAMIGIRTGGIWVAEVLHEALDIGDPLGVIDISFYRDDFTQIGLNPEVRPSQIDFEVDNRHIVLVDDVLHTGRTIRAALNEIFDYGRPKSVTLAALVERTGRELPIEPNVIGVEITLQPQEQIKLTGPESLELVIGNQR